MPKKSLDNTILTIKKKCEVYENPKENLLRICEDIYPILKDCINPGEALRYFLENIDIILPNLEQDGSSEESDTENIKEKNDLARRYRSFADGILFSIVYENYEEPEFYLKLWNEIDKNPILKNDNARAYALYDILLDDLIPYCHLSLGLQASEDELEAAYKRLIPVIRKVNFIAAYKFNSKVERAFHFDELLNELDNASDRALILAYLVSRCASNLDNSED